MNQTQSIIVYRNPLEAAFWEGGLAGPVFVFVLAFLVSLLVLIKVQEFTFKKAKWRMHGNAYNFSGYAIITVSLALAFFATVKVMV